MQPYSYQPVHSAWVSEIPSHWKFDRIKDICTLNPTRKQSKGDADELVSILPMECVSEDGQITSSYQYACCDVDKGLNYFENGDVIFAKITPCMENGKGAFVHGLQTRIAFGSTEFFVLRPSVQLDGKFLYLLTHNSFFRNFLAANMKGAAGQQRVPAKFFQLCDVPVPPIEEQRAIAGFLDEACGKIDAAIQVKREQVAMLDVMAKAILNKAVLEGLNPSVPKQTINNIWFKTLPAHWQLRRLKDVSTMQTGVTLGKDYDGETDERPYLRVANVQDGHLALDDVKTIKLPPHLVRRYELQDGDVLMNEGGDLDKLGRGHVWHNEIPGCLHQNHVFALRCFPHKLLPDYLTLLTSSTHGRAYFEIMGKKTTNLASINSTKVNLFPVPLPPVTEQSQIVQWVRHERGKIKQAQDAVNAQISVLEAYKKSLVHECVTGKKQVWRGG